MWPERSKLCLSRLIGPDLSADRGLKRVLRLDRADLEPLKEIRTDLRSDWADGGPEA